MSTPEPEHTGPRDGVRLPWSRSDRLLARAVVRPLQSFLETESASGVFLLAAAVIALVWSNAFPASYASVWRTELSVGVGDHVVVHEVREWVNEGLMALFFFVVGLELKRELTTGELRDPRSVAVPAIAALGGMVVPASVYLAVNAGGAGSEGWGVPVATDIAFAVGILTLAAPRAPGSLRAFLLTLAIVDDLGAILIIALVYADGASASALLAALTLVLAIVALQRAHVRWMPPYVALGVGLWAAVLASGVHATVAGVVLGLLTPSMPFQRPAAVSEEAHRIADETVDDPSPPDADAHHWARLAELSREAVSPLSRLEGLLHPWTGFLVVPVFALANAGVRLSWDGVGEALTGPIGLGVLVGLTLGKPVGIALAGVLAVRTGAGRLPEGARVRHLVGVGAVAGIGFTVALFIADLAFEGSQLAQAKIGVLVASVASGVLGAVILRR